ncbi:MAG: M23 family metallopeptidase [Propionicimonas sp.]
MKIHAPRADKRRRAVTEDSSSTGESAGGQPEAGQSPWRRGLTLAAVSGIGILTLSLFGASAATSPSLAFADQGPIGTAGIAEDRVGSTSRSDDRPALSVAELARVRAQVIATASEKIEAGQEQAALEARQVELGEAAVSVTAEADRLRNLTKFVWPTKGGVSSVYGMRLHPILNYYRMHDGDDIGGTCGQPIWAAQSGTVVKAAMGYNGGSGNNVRINHGDINGDNVQTGYLHMLDFSVKVGDKINKGDVIGHVGSTGLSTACHLHFSAYVNGSGSNPMRFIGWNTKD